MKNLCDYNYYQNSHECDAYLQFGLNKIVSQLLAAGMNEIFIGK